jgi:hypothetical protein
MRDWRDVVRQKLAALALEPEEKREVFEELAEHLEETYQSLLRQGISEQSATQRALSEVSDWNDLRRKIDSARKKENNMSDRVKQFWLPSIVTLVLSMGLLALIQIFGPKPWLFGWNGSSRWPFVAPALMVYVPWLLSLPLIGAMGAYLSNRAGGSQRAVFSSIVFPVLPYLALFLIAVPVALILDDHVAHNVMFRALFVGLLAWVLVPGAALLAGGLLTRFFLSGRLEPRRIAGS